MRFCPRCGSRYEHERFCPEDGAPTELLPDAGPAKDAVLGSLVDGRYQIDEQIGEGGMGVVYKATHITLNKPLALKVLRGDMAKDPEAVQRFMQEAQAATSIGHENIIDINDFGTLPDGTAYFVMEYLRGQSLSDLIKRGGSIPTGDALHVLRQIASALGAAHARGIVHRDLKPDNVFVLTRGEIENFVKVLDFGIAKVGTSKNRLTRTGMVFGTPHYMSPEQAAGQGVDARTDIYALGVIMYEMFTGRVPFDADTFMGVLHKHMFEKPAAMFGGESERQLGALEQITMCALEKKPENRYESMDALVADLDRVMGGGQARSPSGQRVSPELADALEPRSKSEMHIERQFPVVEPPYPVYESEPAEPERARWPFVLGGLVLLVGGLAYGLSGDDAPASSLAKPVDGTPLAPEQPLLPNSESQPRPASSEVGAIDDTRRSADPVDQERVVPPPVPEVVSIFLASTPSGADIVMDGAIVGQTPAQLPQPTSGERTIELRLEGYDYQLVKLLAKGPNRLDVALHRTGSAFAKKPVKQVAKSVTAKTPPKKVAEPAKTTTPPAPPKRKRLSSEVVDPWSD